MQERPMSSSFEAGSATLRFAGAIDEFEVAAFGEAIGVASAQVTGALRIDLTEVDYLPSVAISELIRATRSAANGATFEIVAATGSIAERVLYLTGLPYLAL